MSYMVKSFEDIFFLPFRGIRVMLLYEKEVRIRRNLTVSDKWETVGHMKCCKPTNGRS